MVLAACSPYFYAMFTGFTERESSRVTLQGLDPEALQTLVDYVYTSLVEVKKTCHVAALEVNPGDRGKRPESFARSEPSPTW